MGLLNRLNNLLSHPINQTRITFDDLIGLEFLSLAEDISILSNDFFKEGCLEITCFIPDPKILSLTSGNSSALKNPDASFRLIKASSIASFFSFLSMIDYCKYLILSSRSSRLDYYTKAL